jgi:ferredoxin-thioredoxin reductase catalytic chain
MTEARVSDLHKRLKEEAEAGGYRLNPDQEFTLDLVRALLVNEKRYGYWACPCRLASGQKEKDLDIICPCDYRDPDLDDFGCCFCALYVSREIAEGRQKARSIPDRKAAAKEKKMDQERPLGNKLENLPLPVWRCKVCGYLCARENPPEICPICKVPRERFERFI